MSDGNSALRGLVANVAAAYFSNSHVSISEIPDVVSRIAQSLASVDEPAPVALLAAVERPAPEDEAEPRRRAVNGRPSKAAEPLSHARMASAAEIRRSIRSDGLISFEDGRSYKTLKRHLRHRGLTPAEYREKWGLPSDYPMVCADSSARRSALAKEIGLGQKPPPRQPARRNARRR